MNKNNKFEISRLIYNKKSIDKIDKKIKLLGNESKIKTISFLDNRIITTVIIFIIVLFISKIGFVLAPIASILYYILIERIKIDNKIKQREKTIESEAITFFEILTLAIDAGRNLESAIKVTTDSTEGILSDEFKEVIREVNYGKSITEAMQSLNERISSETIRNIILSITEANIYGSSIIESLNNQIEYLREKRKMEVKAEISKVPIKISVLSVIFFIPIILLIILLPVLINYIG